jgi:RNA 2',3'-cyclic 3'-phosphodiesterase
MVRCFIAVECNEAKIITGIRNVQGLLETTGGKLKHVEPENIHLTLKFLGEIEHNKADQVKKIIEEISFKPFWVKVEGVGVFPNLSRPRTVWAGVSKGKEELTEIFEEVDEEMFELGFDKERRRFHPHFTISRVRSGRNRESLVEELMRLQDHPFGEINVDHIELKKSVLTPSGPIYSTLAKSKQR